MASGDGIRSFWFPDRKIAVTSPRQRSKAAVPMSSSPLVLRPRYKQFWIWRPPLEALASSWALSPRRTTIVNDGEIRSGEGCKVRLKWRSKARKWTSWRWPNPPLDEVPAPLSRDERRSSRGISTHSSSSAATFKWKQLNTSRNYHSENTLTLTLIYLDPFNWLIQINFLNTLAFNE